MLCAVLALGIACGAEASLRTDLLSLHMPSIVEDVAEAPW